jgi:hypothetical protein
MGWEEREVVIICFKILPNNLAKIKQNTKKFGLLFQPWDLNHGSSACELTILLHS